MKIFCKFTSLIIGAVLSLAVVFFSLRSLDEPMLNKKFYSLDCPPIFLSNVSYGSDPSQTMDIYLPKQWDTTTPVILVIHGGGWVSGDKDDAHGLLVMFAQQYPECAVVNLNYRLASESSPAFPKQPQDIASAVRKLREDYNLSQKYFVYGSSAGGFLAMMYAYAFDSTNLVQGVFSSVGLCDLTDSKFQSGSSRMYADVIVGPGSFTTDTAKYLEASPVNYIDEETPPTIAFYGEDDSLVPVSQKVILAEELEANGVQNVVISYNDAGHNWNQAALEDCKQRLFKFVEKNLYLRKVSQSAQDLRRR
jgi:acetyl esterase/lipase